MTAKTDAFKKFPSQWEFADNPIIVEEWRVDTAEKLQKRIAKAEQEQFIVEGDKEAENFYRGYLQLAKELLQSLK